jgi:hypothetical protein
MLKYILVFVLAYTLGQNLWAYPTLDGISFGFGAFGYHHTWSE